ncbi:hypothetical protein ACFV2V_16325 [Streptomyces sp. NPDC059698]|uniref:hypothetical protein n=1 Tax=unclassified Streptomyces TaxID=2593676 RepID=UPI00116140C6|nr:hypothetical protein [Streptomyces sp. CB02366]WSS54620.1 hypothetical protein OG543_04165 [Streptomyces sp. NBC_01178]
MLLSISVAVVVPKTSSFCVDDFTGGSFLVFSGFSPGGASSRRRGIRTRRLPTYTPPKEM